MESINKKLRLDLQQFAREKAQYLKNAADEKTQYLKNAADEKAQYLKNAADEKAQYLKNAADEKAQYLKNAADEKEMYSESFLEIQANFIQNELILSEIFISVETWANGCIKEASKQFCDFFGYNEAEVLGKNLSFLKTDIHPPEFFTRYLDTIMNGKVWRGEMSVKSKNGDIFWVYNTVIPVLDDAKKIKKFFCFMNDVTEWRNAENEKTQLQEQLLQSQKLDSIGQLASGIAHDFNNILTPIIGFSRMGRLLIEKQDFVKATDCLIRIEKSANRAADLVDKMLLFSREKTIKAEHPIQAVQVIQEVIDISSLLRSGIGITVPLLFDDATKENCPSILIDSSELHQIITNLIVNASDAITESSQAFGKIKIRLSLETIVESKKHYCNACDKELQGEYVVISVSDTGIGISAEKISRIFEPFFTTKEVGKGTGLGLSVVIGILHNVNAHIVVKSELGKGTTFSLFFPPVMDYVHNEMKIVNQISLLPEADLKICVVDDEDDISYLLKEELSDLGYFVQTFKNGLEAFSFINDNPDYFDVVVTDYVMPIMNGLILSEKILKKCPQMPILILTGNNQLKSIPNLPIGNVFLLKKPFDISELDITIKKLFIGK